MTFKELLQACASGEMPKVVFEGKECKVLTIKNGDGYYGCGVDVPGIPYVVWFSAESRQDNRRKYMSELSLPAAQEKKIDLCRITDDGVHKWFYRNDAKICTACGEMYPR